MVIKGKGAMAWKVTEQGERWETCVGITGLVREKTEKFSLWFLYFPLFIFDYIYEVLVTHLTFRIVNIHQQQIFKNQISVM